MCTTPFYIFYDVVGATELRLETQDARGPCKKRKLEGHTQATAVDGLVQYVYYVLQYAWVVVFLYCSYDWGDDLFAIAESGLGRTKKMW